MTNSSSANQAARALLALAKSFEAKADVDRRKKSQFQKFQIDSLRSVRQKRTRGAQNDPELFVMNLVLAERQLREMERSGDLNTSRRAISEFVSALRSFISISRPQSAAHVRYLAWELGQGMKDLSR